MKRPYRQCDPPPTGATKNEPNPQIRKTQPRALFALTRVHSRPIIHPHPGKRPSGKPFPYNGTPLTPTPATFYKTKTQQAPCHHLLHFSPERQILRRILFLKRSRQWGASPRINSRSSEKQVVGGGRTEYSKTCLRLGNQRHGACKAGEAAGQQRKRVNCGPGSANCKIRRNPTQRRSVSRPPLVRSCGAVAEKT